MWFHEAVWRPFPVLLPLVIIFHVVAYRASTIHLYTGNGATPRIGDRIIEDARVWGDDPAWRKSWTGTVGGIIFVLFILPWLLEFFGCSERYYVPAGSGEPVVNVVPVVLRKVVEKEIFIVDHQSAITVHVPKLEASANGEQAGG